jgi:hypothetical protein
LSLYRIFLGSKSEFSENSLHSHRGQSPLKKPLKSQIPAKNLG